MPYKKGDVLKSDDCRNKILVALDGVYLTSCFWKTADRSEDLSKKTGTWMTDVELNADDWSLCPPDQTLLPAEPWKPEEGKHYWIGQINSEGLPVGLVTRWDNDDKDRKHLSIGNVHKTSEEAIEWACKRYGITKP